MFLKNMVWLWYIFIKKWIDKREEGGVQIYFLPNEWTCHRYKYIDLKILGVLLVKILINSAKTYGVIYICENVNGIFLSESVQKRLGIISSTYPNSINDDSSQLTAIDGMWLPPLSRSASTTWQHTLPSDEGEQRQTWEMDPVDLCLECF